MEPWRTGLRYNELDDALCSALVELEDHQNKALVELRGLMAIGSESTAALSVSRLIRLSRAVTAVEIAWKVHLGGNVDDYVSLDEGEVE